MDAAASDKTCAETSNQARPHQRAAKGGRRQGRPV